MPTSLFCQPSRRLSSHPSFAVKQESLAALRPIESKHVPEIRILRVKRPGGLCHGYIDGAWYLASRLQLRRLANIYHPTRVLCQHTVHPPPCPHPFFLFLSRSGKFPEFVRVLYVPTRTTLSCGWPFCRSTSFFTSSNDHILLPGTAASSSLPLPLLLPTEYHLPARHNALSCRGDMLCRGAHWGCMYAGRRVDGDKAAGILTSPGPESRSADWPHMATSRRGAAIAREARGRHGGDETNAYCNIPFCVMTRRC